MWKKYKISVDKFVQNSKDDYFQLNVPPIDVDEEFLDSVKNDDDEFNSLYDVFYTKTFDAHGYDKSICIKPKNTCYYNIYEFMVLLRYIQKYKLYAHTPEKDIKIHYALYWRDKSFLEAGCVVVDEDYPIIYNFYSSDVVEDIFHYLYKNQ